MIRMILCATTLAFVTAHSLAQRGPAPNLPATEVRDAIKEGETRRRAGVQLKDQNIVVRIEGPYARVVNLSGAASRRGETLLPTDIPADVLDASVWIHIAPDFTVPD